MPWTDADRDSFVRYMIRPDVTDEEVAGARRTTYSDAACDIGLSAGC